jgi:hypothetical protein
MKRTKTAKKKQTTKKKQATKNKQSANFTIDDAAEFFRAFFDAEFKVLEASLRGASTSTFKKLHARMRSMCADDVVYSINQYDRADLKGDWKAAFENTLKSLAPRQLFVVEQHLVRNRRLYCGIASAPRRSQRITGYQMRFWANSSLRLVSKDTLCAECTGFGKLGESRCNDCYGRGWHYNGGDRIISAKARAIRKLVRPTQDESMQQYDALG